MAGILYICPTPIGNLEDITLRAIRILKEVDIIACEDTRVTQKLLNRYEISTKLTSYHKYSERQKSEYILNLLKEGKDIALVSDAGTPLISDPGSELIRRCFDENLKIIPLPGASAVITAASASCLNNSGFIFLGFLPKSKEERENLLLKYKDINIAFYESPQRLIKTLQNIHYVLKNPTITIARELTKLYEEVIRDSTENLIKYYIQNTPKGELCCIIEKILSEEEKQIDSNLLLKIKMLKKEGYSTKEVSKILSLLEDIPKSKIYNASLEL